MRPGGSYDWAPAVAVGYRPRLDMSYRFHVQYRNDDDEIDRDVFIDGTGGVNALSITLAEEAYPEVYVGLGVDFLRGDYDIEERTVHPSGVDDSSSRNSFDKVNGTQITVGVLAEMLHRVDVAVVYRSGFDLEGDYSLRPAGATEPARGSFRHGYPDALAIGFEYHPRNEIMTTVSLDAEYVRWSTFEDSMVEDPDLDDTVEYRLGVEHQFYNRSHVRFGFSYQPAYFDKRTTRAAFCGGVGLDVVGVRVDLAGQMGVRQYDIDLGRVRETTTLVVATVTRRF
jgi:hypothetical protein